MDEVVEISGLENACRLCLTTEQTRSSIFGVPHISVPFAEKIRSCLSIQVTSNDKLSTLVCTACIKNVNQWHTYKDTCLQSQEKLQQWLTKQNNIVPLVTVKEEPVNAELQGDSTNVTTNESNTVNHEVPNSDGMEVDTETIESTAAKNNVQAVPEQPPKINDRINKDYNTMCQIKNEPVDTEDEDDCNVDVESVNSGELLINPMAVAMANTVSNDRIMEADSTQKFSSRRYGTKKKIRRGPHTHFRGLRLFKKKCVHCKINLHSKYSYTQHMSRYHGIVNCLATNESNKPLSQPLVRKQKYKLSEPVSNVEAIADTQKEPNLEESDFEKMIKTDPLTPVQKDIIGQLKTFSCFSCKQTFFDRRHTLNHIKQHMPDLRPFTCIACFTEFSDRSMYKIHCGASFECAMKIALVVPRVGNEKYFTCNMCLRSLLNRQELLTHLAMHGNKQNKQLTTPLRSPPKMKSPVSSHSPSYKKDSVSSKIYTSNVPGPYMNGDPAHNHMCDLCGMIYRYKPNMFKHRNLCSTLPENIRTSYRCAHCSMTYLVYKKFYTHTLYDHKTHEITCFTCRARFVTADDYLVHHESHRNNSVPVNVKINDTVLDKQVDGENYGMASDKLNSTIHSNNVAEKSFNCALCGEDFATKLELTEHRNLHLKVKIYSCVICRSMFSSSGTLELHMKEHGIDDTADQAANSSCIEYGRGYRSQNSFNDSSLSVTSDPGGKFNHCYECGKNFSNLANLKRHERNLHIKQKRRWSCEECKRRFKSAEDYDEHVRLTHNPQQQMQIQLPVQTQLSITTGRPVMQCPKCPKTFTYQGNLILHCQNVHKENHFERIKANASTRQSIPPAPVLSPQATAAPHSHTCNICGKTFREEQSLKTHRGWHLRTSYRLKVDKNASLDETVMSGPGYTMTMMTPPKPAKARKSFPNNPAQKQLNALKSLQCQVCDDRFVDVAELRKHLWDIHCARNKPEKTFTNELQCELCTNQFADEEALANHMKWHSQNPILNDNSINENDAEMDAVTPAPLPSLPISKTKKSFYCETCGKYYSNRKMFWRHKKLHKGLPASSVMNFQSLQTRRNYCQPCQKAFSTDASLRRHKSSPCHLSAVRAQNQAPSKKITTTAMIHHPPPDMRLQVVKKEPGLDYGGQVIQIVKKRPVTCHICKAMFPNMSVLYQHKQLTHRAGSGNKEKVNTQEKKCVPIVSAEGLVCCNLCGKQFPGIPNLKQHFTLKHKAKSSSFPCFSPGCKLVFSSAHSLKSHETSHSSMMYNCHLCDRHVFSKASMTKHMLTMHKAIYQSGANKSTLWSETDLTNYTVKNCNGTACPKCKIKYPNLRALKIHYLKFHEKT